MEKSRLEGLVESGLSQRKIAEMTGVSQASIRYWLQHYGLVTRQATRLRERAESVPQTAPITLHLAPPRTANPRKQGDAGVGIAIGWFTCNGYTVSIPLSDTQAYDLIVEAGGAMCRVQVKTTTNKDRNIKLEGQGGNFSQRQRTRPFDRASCDAIFGITAEGSAYFVPVSDIHSRTCLALGHKMERYRVMGPALAPITRRRSAR